MSVDAGGLEPRTMPRTRRARRGHGAGTATLKIGADPWGKIYVDGAQIGQTPRRASEAAGHHPVEIRFTAETPPRKQTFSVDLGADETKSLQADFTR